MIKPEIARSGRRGKNALFGEVVEDWLTLVARVRARDKGTKTNKIRYVDLQTPAFNALERQRALT